MKLRKITGLALSAVMAISQVMPVMATEPSTGTDDPATGNVLAYTNNEILAPTSIKVSFNPQGYDVVLRGTGNDAVKSTDQIVSLNYGFASNATNDMLAKVSFEAAYEPGAGAEKEIEFVSTPEEAQAKSETNENGAEKGELKVYLAVATNTAAITASLVGDGTDFEVDENGATTVTGDLLADVDMTAAAAATNVAFVDNKADIALKLNKATYTVEDDYEVTFATTQSELASHMILAEEGLGGIGGFTFTGAMNPDADWTKAKVDAISITPTWDLTTEATDDDEVIDGTYAQVAVAPEFLPCAVNISGGKAYVGLTSSEGFTSQVTAVNIDGNDWTTGWSYSNGWVTINSAPASGTVIKVVSDGKTYKATVQ